MMLGCWVSGSGCRRTAYGGSKRRRGGHASNDTLHPMKLECCVGMIVKYTQVGTDCQAGVHGFRGVHTTLAKSVHSGSWFSVAHTCAQLLGLSTDGAKQEDKQTAM